jgi:hypothetical protein
MGHCGFITAHGRELSMYRRLLIYRAVEFLDWSTAIVVMAAPELNGGFRADVPNTRLVANQRIISVLPGETTLVPSVSLVRVGEVGLTLLAS